jgi:formylglycine-generating enzyme required for sulfatase activity
MRGGCWAYDAPALRAAARTLAPPHQRLNLAGFRIVVDATAEELA